MRIAFVVMRFPLLSETFILNQITGLLDRGHSVDIYATHRADHSTLHPDVEGYGLLKRTTYLLEDMPTHLWPRLRDVLTGLGDALRHGSQEIPRALNPFRYGKQALGLRPFYATRALVHTGRRDYDIIHCQFGPMGNLGVLLRDIGMLSGCIVTTFHGLDIRLGVQKGGGIYAPLRAKGDCVLAISPYNRQHLEQFGFAPDKIIDHPVGIAFRRFPFRWAEDAPPLQDGEPLRIITVARLVPEKGIEYGLRALAELRQRKPALQFEYRIIGHGPLEGSLREMAERLDLSHVVRFLGAMDQLQVLQELQQAHLFLLPSASEALPVSLMEALASGLPVIATQVGSINQLVSEGRTGFLVHPGDVPALADKLVYLVEHPDQWPAMGCAGREFIRQHYDVDMLNERLVQIYRQLLTRDSGFCIPGKGIR